MCCICILFFNGVSHLSASIVNTTSMEHVDLLQLCTWRDITPNTQHSVVHPHLQVLGQFCHQKPRRCKSATRWKMKLGLWLNSGFGSRKEKRSQALISWAPRLSPALMRLTGYRSATITAAYKSYQWQDCGIVKHSAQRLQTTTMRPNYVVYPPFHLEITDIPLSVASITYIMW